MARPTEEAEVRKAGHQKRASNWLDQMARSWGGGAILVFICLGIGAFDKALVLPFLVLLLLVGIPWSVRQRRRQP